MSNYISREAASADECKHKIKTPFARIVVEGILEKPYYNIWYFNPADGECHIGFGSYCLDNVFNWLAEEFEITEPRTDVAPVVHGEWIERALRPTCSLCGFSGSLIDAPISPFKYCPNCGVKMDKEEK